MNVTARRTKLDFARQMKELVDVHYPRAHQITLVMDNLNTHRLSTLYEAFEPPKRGASWTKLNRLYPKIELK